VPRGHPRNDMNRFIEFTAAHPYLVAAIVVVALIAVVLELRHRATGSGAVGPTEAVLLANQGALMLDVRNSDEHFAEGHIIDARHVRGSDLEANVETLKKYREKNVVVYCDTGATSAAAMRLLKSKGFSKVFNLRGGLEAWKKENLPVVREAGKNAGRLARNDKGARSS
jgi:rhodanese-related sulfurtransferase